MGVTKKRTMDGAFLFATAVTGIVAIGQILSYPSSVRDILNGQFVDGVTVQYPALYTALAPVFQFADRITMLSVKQMLVFLLYVNAAWLAWRAFSLFTRTSSIKGSDILGEIVRFVGVNALVLLCVSLAIFLPRPIPTLAAADPDVIVLDFHTHTGHSWDASPSATLSNQIRRREAGGFNAFFVTDHNNRYNASEPGFTSTARAPRGAPIPLRGEEVSWSLFNLMVLGPEMEDTGERIPRREKALRLLLRNRDNPETLVFATTDADWWKHPEVLDPLVLAGLNGVELAKASPRGLDLTVEDREIMVRYARRNNLIVTGASDNHGFGYTDYVWNLLRLPGWRSMDAGTLEKAVLAEIRRLSPGALTILTRIKSEPTRNSFLMAIDPLRQVWEMLRSLPRSQAAVFVLYAWLPYVVRLAYNGFLRTKAAGR